MQWSVKVQAVKTMNKVYSKAAVISSHPPQQNFLYVMHSGETEMGSTEK